MFLAAHAAKARVPAFLHDDDDGPDFEYLEDEENDMDEVEASTREEDRRRADEAGVAGVTPPSPVSIRASTPPQPLVPPPPETPRPRIVTARQQSEKLRAEGERRAAMPIENENETAVAEIERGVLGGSGGDTEGHRLGKKRSRSDSSGRSERNRL